MKLHWKSLLSKIPEVLKKALKSEFFFSQNIMKKRRVNQTTLLQFIFRNTIIERKKKVHVATVQFDMLLGFPCSFSFHRSMPLSPYRNSLRF